MDNTARKLLATEIVNEAKEVSGNTDLLRVFLITNSADIGREYEFISKLMKNVSTTDADKAIYQKALKTLINVSLKRIELTSIIYGVGDSVEFATETAQIKETEEQVADVEEGKTILMLPTIDQLIERVKTALKEGTDPKLADESAFELLKTSVGQGRALNTEGQPETWDNAKIADTIATIRVEITPKEEEKVVDAFGFETIYNHFNEMINNGKSEPEIKDMLKALLIGKTISDKSGNTLIKDEEVYNDYYTRILQNVITVGIDAFKLKKEKEEHTPKIADVAAKAETEVAPFLEELDKNEKSLSISEATKKFRSIFTSAGFKLSLSEALGKVEKIAERIAPNLMARRRESAKTSTPLSTGKPVEIYDESHNIKESNKALWTEVENFNLLSQVFDKALELTKADHWRDAISMCTVLITEGKIKETENSEKPLDWDKDQVMTWYYGNVECTAIGVTRSDKIVGIEEAQIVEDTNSTNNEIKKEGTQEPAKTSESLPEGDKKNEEVKQGPVPQAGTIESKEGLVRPLKDNSLWSDKYKFKEFMVKTDHNRITGVTFEIVDATQEQEKDLLITEANFTKFLDSQRDILVAKRNEFPNVKKTIHERLSPFYEITASEAQRITGNLGKEADELRKQLKSEKKKETLPEVTEEVNLPAPSTPVVHPVVEVPVVETPVTEIPEIKEEVVVNPPVNQPVENLKEESESNPKDENEDASAIENTAGENSSNGNKKEYAGYEAIIKAKTKAEMHKEIYAKAAEFANLEEGTKSVFEIVNVARKDKRYKKSQVHNWSPTPSADLLEAIKRIVATGKELSEKKSN